MYFLNLDLCQDFYISSLNGPDRSSETGYDISEQNVDRSDICYFLNPSIASFNISKDLSFPYTELSRQM